MCWPGLVGCPDGPALPAHVRLSVRPAFRPPWAPCPFGSLGMTTHIYGDTLLNFDGKKGEAVETGPAGTTTRMASTWPIVQVGWGCHTCRSAHSSCLRPPSVSVTPTGVAGRGWALQRVRGRRARGVGGRGHAVAWRGVVVTLMCESCHRNAPRSAPPGPAPGRCAP